MSTRTAYKIRIYPNKEQESLIQKTFGCSRFVYNKFLEEANKNYKNKLNNNGIIPENQKYITIPELKIQFPFLKEIDSHAPCSAWQNIGNAFKAYKRRKENPEKYKGKLGYPIFHKKGKSKDSYRTNNTNEAIRLEVGKLRLPKLGLIQAVLHRKIKGEIKSVTVSQNSCKEYFASIITKQKPIKISNSIIKKVPQDKKILGIDMSLPSFAALSDKVIYNKAITTFVNHYKLNEDKIAKAKRSISRKKRYSNNRNKAKIKLSKITTKVANKSKEFIHKLTFDIVNNFDVVVVEDINLIEMADSKSEFKFGKSVYTINFGMFRTILEYKLVNAGKEFVKANKWFPSTQLCNVCGYRNTETKDLSVREWNCPCCGTQHERDHNSSLNLVNYYKDLHNISREKYVKVADATSETLNDHGLCLEKSMDVGNSINLIKTTGCQQMSLDICLSVPQSSSFRTR